MVRQLFFPSLYLLFSLLLLLLLLSLALSATAAITSHTSVLVCLLLCSSFQEEKSAIPPTLPIPHAAPTVVVGDDAIESAEVPRPSTVTVPSLKLPSISSSSSAIEEISALERKDRKGEETLPEAEEVKVHSNGIEEESQEATAADGGGDAAAGVSDNEIAEDPQEKLRRARMQHFAHVGSPREESKNDSADPKPEE